MSEVQQRPPPALRGRGTSRGGRSGSSYGTRGGRAAPRNTNGDSSALEDQGELGQLKKQYSSQLESIKEMFPDWTSEDIVFALQENEGDLENTVSKISEGFTTQWGEVKKKTKFDRSRSKVQDSAVTGNKPDGTQPGRRGGRGAFDSPRGGRGRGGIEPRGGRGGRGGRGTTNGTPHQNRPEDSQTSPGASWGEASTAETATSGAWGEKSGEAWMSGAGEESKKDTDIDAGGWDAPAGGTTSGRGDSAEVNAPEKPVVKSSIIPTVTKLSWASIVAPKPAPPTPAPKKPTPPKQPVAPPASQQPAALHAKEPEIVAEHPAPKEATPEPEPESAIPKPAEPITPVEIEPEPEAKSDPEITETTETQALTEDNLEKIEDVAPPPPSTTVASTIASPIPPISSGSSVIAPPPSQISVPPPVPTRLAGGGLLPKTAPSRNASYNRRVFEQEEGVIMPSNHGAVDRAALQFGSMGLNGDLDEDEEVEQAETVSQPPVPSPIGQALTALPPTGPSQLSAPQPPITEALPTPRQAPGLPVQPQTVAQQPSPQPPLAPQSMTQQQPINQHLSNQYNRYAMQETQQAQIKPYEAFGQQVQQQHAAQSAQAQSQPSHSQAQQQQQQAYAGYAQSQMQPHQQQQQHNPLGAGATSAPEYHSSYYGERPPGFGGLYANSNYMQPHQAQAQQDAGAAQQRAASGLSGAGEAPGQIPNTVPAPGQVQQQPTSRYAAGQLGEQTSGHATPSPGIPTAQQTSQPHQQSVAGYPAMPYGYQTHPYYNQFIPQNYYSQPSPFGKHQNIYGYPQGYMSPQYSDHSSSPAGIAGFGAPSAQGRETVAGISDYSRINASASQQQQQSIPQHSSAGGYGSGIPNFLNSRGLPQEQQQLGGPGVGQQQVGQQAQNDDSLKFGENKPPTGPASGPSLQGQPGRPGSATSGVAPQQAGQPQAGMYGSHLNHNLHGHHQGQQSQYAGSAYSMYGAGYPNQYNQTTGRHSNNSGWAYGGHQ